MQFDRGDLNQIPIGAFDQRAGVMLLNKTDLWFQYLADKMGLKDEVIAHPGFCWLASIGTGLSRYIKEPTLIGDILAQLAMEMHTSGFLSEGGGLLEGGILALPESLNAILIHHGQDIETVLVPIDANDITLLEQVLKLSSLILFPYYRTRHGVNFHTITAISAGADPKRSAIPEFLAKVFHLPTGIIYYDSDPKEHGLKFIPFQVLQRLWKHESHSGLLFLPIIFGIYPRSNMPSI